MKMLWHPPGTDREIWVGDRDEVAALCGQPPEWGLTYAGYARKGLPKTNPAPTAVTVDVETRRDMYPLDTVLAWDARRLGPGFRIRTDHR